MKSLLLRHRHLTALILLVVLIGLVWFVRSAEAHSMEIALWHWLKDFHEWLKQTPPLVFFTLAGALPTVGVPIVGFYLLSAGLYAPHTALLWLVYSVVLNLLLTYVIGRLGRDWITRWLARSGRTIPQIPPKHRIWMTAAVRVMPGAPLIVQNFLLVMAGVPLVPFVLVSLPLEMLIAAGYVLIGRSLFTGNWQMGFIAVIVVVIAVLVIRRLRRRTNEKRIALEAAANQKLAEQLAAADTATVDTSAASPNPSSGGAEQ